MEIISELPAKLPYNNPVVTLGNFDGVHRGHQKIFRKVVEKAQEIGGTPIAITFNPHPVRVLAPERGMKMITTVEDKRLLIERMGLQVLICIPFDREFAHTEPDDFIRDTLVERLGTKWVIVGHSYSFGKGKKGTTTLLRARGRKYGFGVNVVRYAEFNAEKVSSSRIRTIIHRGRVCEAAQMLDRAYHIDGTVVKGAGRGETLLHTPTANIRTRHELVPKEGVYAVRVSMHGSTVYDGVANIGTNPTFGGGAMSYEAHLFDFHGDLAGKQLRMHFIERIRDEKKFSGSDELLEQIKKDIHKAKEILGNTTVPLFM